MSKPISASILSSLFILLFSACASAPQREEPVKAGPSGYLDPNDADGTRIDLDGLQRALKLDSDVETLGYREAAFNTCRAGYGYSASRNCQNRTLAVINIRLQCRASEGTISTALDASDLMAIAGKEVAWALIGTVGRARTDGQGYAQIRGIFPRSPKRERLKVAVGTQFLYMRANEISRVVTPRPWCENDL